LVGIVSQFAPNPPFAAVQMAHVIQPNAVPVKKQATQTATVCMWGICTWPLGMWAIMNNMVFLLLVF
jgi:hypothetical protein